jgi:hypothetical protein
MLTKRRIITVIMIVTLLLGCRLTIAPDTATQEQPISVETSVFLTRAFDFAVQTAAAGSGNTTDQTATTAEPEVQAVEPTSDTPMISASTDTNCRRGPATVYEAISYLLVGSTSEVVNKYQNGLWWVIKDPNNPNQRCWVWGTTTTVTGNWQQLPEATVPPTPTVYVEPDTGPELSIQALLNILNTGTYNGSCPVDVHLTGTITANKAVLVSYSWLRSSIPFESGTISFSGPGSVTVSGTVTFLGSSTGSFRLKVDSPVSVTSNGMSYIVNCTP